MALEIAASLSFSRTQVIMTDTTGAYNATSNPTGYGSPNAEFSDYAHYVIIRKKNVNEVDDEVLALDTYNEVLATEFKADRDVDGWYEGKKLSIPKWAAGTFDEGTVRYHNGSIYISNTSTSQTPGASDEWDEVDSLEDIEDNDTITVTTDGRVTVFNADLYWSKQMALNSQRGHCGVCTDDRKKERLDNIRFHVQCALVADQMGDNTSGEWNVLALIQLGAILT